MSTVSSSTSVISPRALFANPKPSPIRVISEGAPAGAIPFGLGEPTWMPPLPEPAFFQQHSPFAYGPNAGLPELREALAQRYNCSSAQVLVSAGAQAALYAFFAAYLEPGAQILLPDPGFPGYRMVAEQLQAEVKTYPLRADQGFQLQADAVLQALAECPRAKILLLNHPSNPTGALAQPGSRSAILREAEKRGLLVLSDEVYRELSWEEPELDCDDSPNLVRISSLSKAWAGAGLRVGWAIASPEILAPARAVHAAMLTAAPSNNQHLGAWLIRESAQVIAHSCQQLEQRWQALAECCANHWGWVPAKPQAGFYLWLPLPSGSQDALSFCLKIRDQLGVVLVPGSVFGPGGNNHVRLSFAAPPAAIREGIRRLAPLWNHAES